MTIQISTLARASALVLLTLTACGSACLGPNPALMDGGGSDTSDDTSDHGDGDGDDGEAPGLDLGACLAGELGCECGDGDGLARQCEDLDAWCVDGFCESCELGALGCSCLDGECSDPIGMCIAGTCVAA